MNETIVIVVLGNRLKSMDIHPELRGRLDTAITLYHELLSNRKNVNVVLLLSGGTSNNEVSISEAEVMRRYCVDNRIPDEKTIIDDESLDTIGNAFFTRQIIESFKNVVIIYIISSCYHMHRAKYIFKMCFGAKYNLNGKYCYPYNKIDAKRKEKLSLKLALDFFRDINAGEIGVIEKRLFTAHKLYINNRHCRF